MRARLSPRIETWIVRGLTFGTAGLGTAIVVGWGSQADFALGLLCGLLLLGGEIVIGRT